MQLTGVCCTHGLGTRLPIAPADAKDLYDPQSDSEYSEEEEDNLDGEEQGDQPHSDAVPHGGGGGGGEEVPTDK